MEEEKVFENFAKRALLFWYLLVLLSPYTLSNHFSQKGHNFTTSKMPVSQEDFSFC